MPAGVQPRTRQPSRVARRVDDTRVLGEMLISTGVTYSATPQLADYPLLPGPIGVIGGQIGDGPAAAEDPADDESEADAVPEGADDMFALGVERMFQPESTRDLLEKYPVSHLGGPSPPAKQGTAPLLSFPATHTTGLSVWRCSVEAMEDVVGKMRALIGDMSA